MFGNLTNYATEVIERLQERYNNELPNTLTNELTHFVIEPVWLKFKRSNINFDNNDEGILDFLDNMTNQYAESFNNFLTTTKAHIEYLTYFLDGTKVNTPFEKQIISSIMPINQKVDQKLAESKLASGTTGQQLSEITNVGIAWRKALQQYYTPIYQKEYLDGFRWLFKFIFNQYYDYEEDVENEGYKVTFKFGTFDVSGYDDNFIYEYKVGAYGEWVTINQNDLPFEIENVKLLKVRIKTLGEVDIDYISTTCTEESALELYSTELETNLTSPLVDLKENVVIELNGYTEG